MAGATVARRAKADEYTGPPRAWFFGDEWHRRDLEAIFHPRWLIAGHVDEVDGAGKYGYLTFELGDRRAFIRRDEDGELRAYHNFCPHRGALLCEGRTGSATTKSVVCPYHQWGFSVSDGRLMNSRQMHEDFDAEPYGLKPIHLEVWNGLIFVNFSDETPAPLADYLGDVTTGGYDLSSMKLAATTSHEIAANWKVVVENNQECYHCAVSHPELSKIVDWRFLDNDEIFDAHCAERASGQEAIDFTLPTPAMAVGGQSTCRVPVPRLDGNPDPDETAAIHWEPGLAVNISRDHAWFFVPKPIGPERTELRQYWLVHESAVEGEDYDVDELMAFFKTTMLQDRPLCESVQDGMRNPAYQPGPLNRVHQAYNAGFYRWYEQQIIKRYPEFADEVAPV